MTRNPTIGSVFSGIGGFDLGFQRAGFEMAWMCEREPFCRTVLSERFADVPCFDDVTTLRDAPVVDVLVGGFPCQDVSVAGQRRGLAGERTGLFWEFMRLVDELKPKGVVLENVPGLLSSHGGRDFHTVLSALAERGLRRNYRILDSQYFGVPQRRRRVFLVCGVGGFGDRAETVLFESTSRSRDSQTRGEARARTAASLRGRSSRAGVNEPGRGGEDDQNLVTAFTLPSVHRGVGNGHNTNYLPITGPLGGGNDGIGRRSEDVPNLVFATLNSGGNSGGFRTEPGEHLVCSGERARALTASMHKRHDEDTDTLIASPITASAGHHGHSSARGDGRDNLVCGVHANQRGEIRTSDLSGSLNGSKSGKQYEGVYQSGVRRLTPLECERLQGFPDGWTCLCGEGHRGSAFCQCPDTPRYKALGNAVTVNVAEWIAHRMMEAGRLTP